MALKKTKTPQSIIVTGVSGSGKTMTTNYIAQFLCSANSEKMMKKAGHISLIFDVFGNCQTPQNENSSRFIKLIQVKSVFHIKGLHLLSFHCIVVILFYFSSSIVWDMKF